jgi:hypothetical protein
MPAMNVLTSGVCACVCEHARERENDWCALMLVRACMHVAVASVSGFGVSCRVVGPAGQLRRRACVRV